ncbi:UNVERIFIED_CONTAM: hypothetical protein HHA_451470 [Hammondia hammondi]|eukprot:XP_008884300.1 hypothetical protein HHA_451470 [Hammondia hammondi]
MTSVATIFALGGILASWLSKEPWRSKLKCKASLVHLCQTARATGSQAVVLLTEELPQLREAVSTFETNLADSIASDEAALSHAHAEHQNVEQQLQSVSSNLAEKEKLLTDLVGKSEDEAEELLLGSLDAAQKATNEEEDRRAQAEMNL